MKTRILIVVAVIALAVPAHADDAKQMFGKLKGLAGTWQGSMTTIPKTEVEGTATTVTMRVTSMGNVLMHEMTGVGRPDDPITMLYLDENRLALTHYCDAGNRPRMTATMSEDGKSVEFDFLDVAGSTKYGYMRRAVFTFIDDEHHAEEWTFMLPGEKAVKASAVLTRVAAAPSSPAPGEHKHVTE